MSLKDWRSNWRPPQLGNTFSEHVLAVLRKIEAEKERYLEAWYAETLIPPSQAMLMQQTMNDGRIRMWVEERPENLPKPQWPNKLPKGVLP